MLDRIRATFESYGFASIETPSVEELEVLLAKGETDKEIYTIERLQADETAGGESRVGLHYDLTVPFARYVAQHFNDLVFPFKRYQMQRVWRGERPQAGRFREFTQCDIDVIGIDNLAVTFDAELAAVAMQALDAIGVTGVTLHINNRKILQGYIEGCGFKNFTEVLRLLDKSQKIDFKDFRDQLSYLTKTELEAEKERLEAFVKIVELLLVSKQDFVSIKDLQNLGIRNKLFNEGIEELEQVITVLIALGIANYRIDPFIARGFDYYTGTVYEGRFDDAPGFGSVVAGGRYEDLAGAFINKKLPGVGISIGFSRLFAKLLQDKKITATRKSPADVLVALLNEDQREKALTTAQALRARGIKVETYHAPQKLAKQMSYAEKKGIPFVWFPPFEADGAHEVKNMESGVQGPADLQSWKPNAG